jgi:ribosome-binding protein aMBF1 (putative translation factor)
MQERNPAILSPHPLTFLSQGGYNVDTMLWEGNPEALSLLIGNRIRQARQRKKLSQFQLALLTKISEREIMRYERGQGLPSIRRLIKLALALEVSADYLLGLEGAESCASDAPSKGGEQHADH